MGPRRRELQRSLIRAKRKLALLDETAMNANSR